MYDKTKYNTITDEISRFLKFNDFFVSETIKKSEEFETTIISFIWGIIKVLYYYEKRHLFLPSFQVDVLTDVFLEDDFLKLFYRIFSDVNSDEYIFDVITPRILQPNNNIITDSFLSSHFKSFNQKKLEEFVKSLDLRYLDEKLDRNPEMKYHLYYLIFLNYKLFKNILLTQWGILQLEEVLGENIDDNLKWELSLTKERVDHIGVLNIEVFKNYKKMLEWIVSLLTS